MKKIILINLILISIGCTVHKNYYIISQILELPKEELYTMVALEFIKIHNAECIGDCRKTVSCTFEYFDNCLEQIDPTYFHSLGIDFKERKIIGPSVYNLESFGRVVFSKQNDKTDYYFSPLVIEKKSRSIIIQVKTKENKKFIVTFIILNNELYFGSMDEYPNDRCDW